MNYSRPKTSLFSTMPFGNYKFPIRPKTDLRMTFLFGYLLETGNAIMLSAAPNRFYLDEFFSIIEILRNKFFNLVGALSFRQFFPAYSVSVRNKINKIFFVDLIDVFGENNYIRFPVYRNGRTIPF